MNASPSAVGTRCSRATIQSGFLTYQVAPAVAVFSRGGQTPRLGVTPRGLGFHTLVIRLFSELFPDAFLSQCSLICYIGIVDVAIPFLPSVGWGL